MTICNKIPSTKLYFSMWRKPQLCRPAVATSSCSSEAKTWLRERDLINSQFATKRGSDSGDFKMLWETDKFQLWSLEEVHFCLLNKVWECWRKNTHRGSLLPQIRASSLKQLLTLVHIPAMALSGGRPTINTFRGPGKKIFFRWSWRAAMLEVTALFRFCRPVAALWNFTCVTPRVWKCPHRHMDFSLSSQSLCSVCLPTLCLNQRIWHRSADAPGSEDCTQKCSTSDY